MAEPEIVGLGNGWVVTLLVDDDGHLEVFVRNTDETTIHPVEAEISTAHEWGERFTSEGIEHEYQKEQACLQQS